jgi:hypothetical protein
VNISVTKAAVPPCCANCRFNNWEENGPSCAHPAHWDDSQFELDEEDGHVFYCGEEETEGGEIDWDDVCEHHQPGRFHELERSGKLKELIDQRYAEMRVKLAAPKAGEAVADA